MTARNQIAAVIGAGDFIGAAIAKKLAAEGFTLFVGRRNGDKLAPLVNGERDAILVDTPTTTAQATALADWVEKSGKNLRTIYTTHVTATTSSEMAFC